MPTFNLSAPSNVATRRPGLTAIGTLTYPPQPISSSENAAINVTESEAVAQAFDSTENAAINVTEADAIAATVDAAENAGVNVTESESLTALLDTTENAGVNVAETDSIDVLGDFPPRQVRIDVYSADGTTRLGAGPIVSVLECETVEDLDALGTWSAAVPVADPRSALLDHGRQVWIYRESEGLVFRGYVDYLKTTDDANGAKVLVASGFGLERDLAHVDTLPAREFSLANLSTVLSTLVGLVAGWSAGAALATQITYRPESVSVFSGLGSAATITGAHLRADNRTKVVDLDALGDSSGLVFANVADLPVRRTYRSLYPISDIEIQEESGELWNQLIIYGAGEGVAALTLKESTRITPYAIQTGTDAAGNPFYWIEDAASVAAYGARRTTRRVASIAPLANTASARVEASNTLYDVGAAWLSRVSQVRGRYTVSPLGLKHVDPLTGLANFKVGQKVRVAYRGVARDRDGVLTSWRKVDGSLWIMGWKRTYNRDGSDTWDMKLQTVDRPEDNDDQVLSDAVEQIRGLSAGLKPYIANLYSMGRGSVDPSFPLDFLVDFDSNVQFLIQSKIRWSLKKVRTNATGVASGGGATSGGGSSHTHQVSGQTATSGGGSTSGAGASHSHSVSGQSGSATLNTISIEGPTSSATPIPASTQDVDQGHTHVETGGTTANQNQGHTHSLNSHTHQASFNNLLPTSDHTHSISSTTSAAESTHTHSTPNHTHSVDAATSTADVAHTHTVPNHTHALSFGIYEGSAPSAPAIHLWINGTDRSVVLGGPWNATDVEVDISDYLTDPANPGQPLRQSNVVRFTSSELLDIDAVVRSLVTASAVAPT